MVLTQLAVLSWEPAHLGCIFYQALFFWVNLSLLISLILYYCSCYCNPKRFIWCTLASFPLELLTLTEFPLMERTIFSLCCTQPAAAPLLKFHDRYHAFSALASQYPCLSVDTPFSHFPQLWEFHAYILLSCDLQGVSKAGRWWETLPAG